MNSRIRYRVFPNGMGLSMALLVVCLYPSACLYAQAPPTGGTTWEDLGFASLPDDFSDDQMPLFQGLSESRGTWSFKGETVDGDVSSGFAGRVRVSGNPKSGMLPTWKMEWIWEADDSEYMMVDSIMASPRGKAFELMLFRMGPLTKPIAGQPPRRPSPKIFKGAWDPARQTISWTRSSLPVERKAPEDADGDEREQSLTMKVAKDGRVSFDSETQMESGPFRFHADATKRIAKAPAEPVTLTGKHAFKLVTEVMDRRIKPCLPPQATEILLQSERGGHFARYKIAEQDMMDFLDQLWEAKKDSSAHKREQMSGEGEPAQKERMARRFKAIGWEPLENAIIYYSPSKANGAMTTYYYDRETETAYHDTGYW